MEDPAKTPIGLPDGAWSNQPKGMKGVQFSEWMLKNASPTKMLIVNSLMLTITVLSLALSFTPIINKPIRTRIMPVAGRLM